MKKSNRNVLIYFILNIITLGLFTFYVAHKLDLYDKKAWYNRWYYWVLGFICGIIPCLVMVLIFNIQISILVSEKLNVPGKEIYKYPYAWIICLIVPVLGWTLFILLYIYVHIWYVFSLKES